MNELSFYLKRNVVVTRNQLKKHFEIIFEWNFRRMLLIDPNVVCPKPNLLALKFTGKSHFRKGKFTGKVLSRLMFKNHQAEWGLQIISNRIQTFFWNFTPRIRIACFEDSVLTWQVAFWKLSTKWKIQRESNFGW